MPFSNSSQAFQAARTRASIAQTIESEILHMAVYGARAEGMSVREAAAALRVPKSTVSRHWWEHHNCGDKPPRWGNATDYVDAWNAVWVHNDLERISAAPWTWEDLADGTRIIRRRAVAAALRGTDDAER
jgi:hypothetical protein